MSLFWRELPESNKSTQVVEEFYQYFEANRDWPDIMKNWYFYNLFKNIFGFDYIDPQLKSLADELSVIITNLQSGTSEKLDRAKLIKLLKDSNFVRGYSYVDEHNTKAIFEFFKDLKDCINKTSGIRSIEIAEG